MLDELEKNLQLSDLRMKHLTMTLKWFCNFSSISLWYELTYSEATRTIKRGDKLWRIAFGSGFKCNIVSEALYPAKEKCPWMYEIPQFPIDVPKVSDAWYRDKLYSITNCILKNLPSCWLARNWLEHVYSGLRLTMFV